jgi:hypothetical protein
MTTSKVGDAVATTSSPNDICPVATPLPPSAGTSPDVAELFAEGSAATAVTEKVPFPDESIVGVSPASCVKPLTATWEPFAITTLSLGSEIEIAWFGCPEIEMTAGSLLAAWLKAEAPPAERPLADAKELEFAAPALFATPTSRVYPTD